MDSIHDIDGVEYVERGIEFVRAYKELCRQHKCEMAYEAYCHADYVAVYDPTIEVEVFDLGFGTGWIDNAAVYRLALLEDNDAS